MLRSCYQRTIRSIAAPVILMAASSSGFSSTMAKQNLNNPAAKNVAIPSENLEAIEGLAPANLWKQFAILSSIPRPSKQEEAVLQYIKNFADQHDHLTWKEDPVGNLVVFHPGCGTGQSAPAVILQGHVDMVTEKNSDKVHNFETDPILLRRFQKQLDGDSTNNSENWLGAQGTTLGADNGVGVAATLALLEISPTAEDGARPLPPLEALFTIDEETGLTGATELDAQALGLTGTTMLNLDTEEWGELYVGCAGGGESLLKLPLSRRGEDGSASSSKLVELRVEGLLGGHSGINIHEGRANAVLLCAATTSAALEQVDGVDLVAITGGDKHNAIPREARAHLLLSNDAAREGVERIVQESLAAGKAEYGVLEKNLRMSLVDSTTVPSEGDSSCTCRPLEKQSASRLLSMLLALPHGAIKFSHSIPDLVETSNNVASLSMSLDDDTATVLCSTRSSISSALEATRNKLAAVANLAGASLEKTPPYPGWNPDMDSPVLHLAKDLLTQKQQRVPGIKAIHAGLECGLLIEKMGGNVDALSFGPTIVGAHSPDESIHIDTVPPFFDLVQDILAELAKKER